MTSPVGSACLFFLLPGHADVQGPHSQTHRSAEMAQGSTLSVYLHRMCGEEGVQVSKYIRNCVVA